jgi:hypothetical protein
MSNECEGISEGSGLGLIEVLCRNLPGGTEENDENPQGSRCSGRDSNRTPLQYKCRALLLDQSVRSCCIVLQVNAV